MGESNTSDRDMAAVEVPRSTTDDQGYTTMSAGWTSTVGPAVTGAAPEDWLGGPPRPSTDQWYVLHTKSRQEKAVAASLAGMGVDHLLPLVTQVRYYGRRKVSVEQPLFPSYVFLYGRIEQAYTIDRARRLVRIIEVADQRQIEWELRNIRLAVETQVQLDPYPYLQKGVRVEVRSGPMRGVQGLVEDRARNDRLILQIDMLGRATSVEIDGALLEPL